MPHKQKLKVFRAPIGFHDVYVAAPSRKAALEAWGSDHDLFARGMAEQIEDPELIREPLEKPGEIIRRLRGTAAEQIASLPKSRPRARKMPEVPTSAEAHTPPRPPPPKPRPGRTALNEAEKKLGEAEQRHEKERRALARREAELLQERRTVEKRQQLELTKLNRELDSARDKYTKAMGKWDG